MKSLKRQLNKIGAVLVSILMLAPMWPPTLVFAEGGEGKPEVFPDAIYDKWEQDPFTTKGGEVCTVEDGKLRVLSGPSNGNNPGATSNPAVFVNNDFIMPENGFVEMTFSPTSGHTDNRFGLYLNYATPGDALLIGCDVDGWFWQNYKANGGGWYSGARQPAPSEGNPATVRVEWEGKKLTKATVNGKNMFTTMPHDFSSIGGTGNKIALKAGSFGSAVRSGYTVSDIHYTGQEPLAVYDVSGAVQDANGAFVPGVAVSFGSHTATTDADGAYSFQNVIKGEYTLALSKDRFVSKTQSVTVEGDHEIPVSTLAFETWAFATDDAAKEDWKIDPATERGEEINEYGAQGRHFKSGPKNSNNPAATSSAAYFMLDGYTVPENGFFEATFTSPQDAARNRFGIHLNYDGPGNGFFVGCDAGGWFWQNYKNNDGAWYSGPKVPAPAKDTPVTIRIEWDGKSLTKATANGVNMFNVMPHDFSGIGGSGTALGIKAGTWSDHLTDIYMSNVSYSGQPLKEAYKVTGVVANDAAVPVKDAGVKMGNMQALTDADGNYAFYGVVNGTYPLEIIHDDYKAYTGEVKINDVSVEQAPAILTLNEISGHIISSEAMDVLVDTDFPRVIRYTMKDGDKVFGGQSLTLDKIVINNYPITPSVTSEIKSDRVVYTMNAVDTAANINAILTAELVVKNNTLEFNITKVENKLSNTAFPVQTIAIPNHSLISVRTTQQNAEFAGANMSVNTTLSGDTFRKLSEMGAGSSTYVYAFVSADDLAAGMWSNSEQGGATSNTHVTATVEERGAYKSLGLASSFWYYERKISAQGSKGTWVMPPTDMPRTTVIITDDLNNTGKADWQDAAIAFRDIMNNPQGGEQTPELVAWRIAMNFGSHAQNPFLMTLDNAKRVAMHTDGLGQSILLKGYGNEGHDSAHPDFGDIGQRIGGADEMNLLLEEGAKMGARFGVHINTGEMYPEAKAFSDDMVRRNNAGALSYGWNWIDQGIGVDGLYDLGTGNRVARLQELKDQLGDNMDFIYLDIWGNQTSGGEDAWETRYVMKQINDMGWRFGTEFGGVGEYDSTFQHWAMDLEYGGATNKGHNSTIMRFMRNHQKDTWVAERSGFQAAAVAPLLGGAYMTDFEGWQGRNNYDYYIESLYSFNIVTKFLQHYQVSEWEDAPITNVRGINWKPEKRIALTNENDDEVVVTRGATTYTDNVSDYRSRTITLNGKKILEGEMTEMIGGLRITQKSERYLIPWTWDAVTGEAVAKEDEKLYHWNAAGGITTWELPDEWNGLSTVNVYKLTDLGRTEETVIPVVDGKITLEAAAATPYAVYRGEAAANANVEWSVGMHIWDAGFNSGKLDHWTQVGDGTASIVRSQHTNPMLALEGEVSMTQPISDLIPGQRYVAYVGLDNRSEANAHITVKSNGETLATNYSGKSIAKNYVKAYEHNTNSSTIGGSSYFQNMFVFFDAPADTSGLTLTLSRESGAGISYFDSVRITPNESRNIIATDEEGLITHFKQDFENNAQGIYPFVVGNIENVEDNRTHLAELHAPFTQAGWDVKKGDDVLAGDWSVKVNGLVQRNRMVYQTIPQNVRFEPGKEYEVEFKYQMGSPGIYQFVVGNGEYTAAGSKFYDLEMSLGETKTYKATITGADNGQTWIGIYSANKAPDLQGTSGSAANFGGYKEIVLDDLEVRIVNLTPAKELQALITVAEALEEDSYTVESWDVLANALEDAVQLLKNTNATQEQIEAATATLQAAIDALKAAESLEDLRNLYNAEFDSDSKLIRTEETFTTSSWEAYIAVLNSAKAVLDAPSPTRQEINTAYAAMLKIPTTLTNRGSRSALQIVITICSNLNEHVEADFTPEKWAVYATALERAQFLVADENHANASVEDVDVAGKALMEAYQNLWDTSGIVNKDTLIAFIAEANRLLQPGVVEGYIPAAVEALSAELAKAETVMNNAAATAQEVEAATNALLDAISEMHLKGNKSDLQALVDMLSALKETSYTTTSWPAFAKGMSDARVVLASENAAEDHVEEAYKNLETAFAGLVRRAVFDGLNAAIKIAEGILANENQYKPSSIVGLQDELTKAKLVQSNVDAAQQAVNTARDELNAKNILARKKATLSQLLGTLKAAKNINLSRYTRASADVLLKTIQDAETILAGNTDELDQETVDRLNSDIDAGRTGLVLEVPTVPEVTDPVTPTNPPVVTDPVAPTNPPVVPVTPEPTPTPVPVRPLPPVTTPTPHPTAQPTPTPAPAPATSQQPQPPEAQSTPQAQELPQAELPLAQPNKVAAESPSVLAIVFIIISLVLAVALIAVLFKKRKKPDETNTQNK